MATGGIRDVSPYSELAKYYNKVMAHVNYRKWAKYIQNILAGYGIKSGVIIDLGFGTGLFYRHFNFHKFKILGADLSFQMIRRYPDGAALRIVNDICATAVKSQSVDVVLFLYDSINYLRTRSKLNAALSEVSRILKPGGIFIFDIVTRHLCEKFFSDHREVMKLKKVEIIRESFFDPEKSLQYNYFTFRTDEESTREKHIQKIYSISEMTKQTEKHCLSINSSYSGLGFRNASEKSERVHFVCKKYE
jgi:SAM-dependent methyltransferase